MNSRNILLASAIIAAILSAVVAPARTADDSPQIAALQAELKATREQRDQSNNQIAAIIAGATQQIEALRKQIQDLTAKAAPAVASTAPPPASAEKK